MTSSTEVKTNGDYLKVKKKATQTIYWHIFL